MILDGRISRSLARPAPAINALGSLRHGGSHRYTTTTSAASLQATNDAQLFGRDNNFVVGGSIDHGQVDFRANSELGFIYPDLFVGPNPAIPGTGLIIHTRGNIGYSPGQFDARNTYYGLYAYRHLRHHAALSATAGARFNVAKINCWTQLGTSPELNGSAHLPAAQSGRRPSLQVTPG